MFKVGDKVVYRKQCSIIWDGVYTVDAVLSNGDVIERDCQTPREWLSRATSEEISAGHRIDTHIKNHVRVIMTRRKVYLIRAMRYDIAREIAVSFGLRQCAWNFVSDREELQPPFGLPRGYKWTDAIPLKRRKAEDYTLEIAEQRWAEEIARYFGEH